MNRNNKDFLEFYKVETILSKVQTSMNSTVCNCNCQLTMNLFGPNLLKSENPEVYDFSSP